MKPVIGINLDVSKGPKREVAVQSNYYECILRSGAIPVLLPPMPSEDLQEVLDKLSGMMFIGGLDYCPSIYGEKPHPTVELVESERGTFDLLLMKEALAKERLPVLGICAGAQLLNLSQGGSLIQDINDQCTAQGVEHSSRNGWVDGWSLHDVTLKDGSRLADIFGIKKLAVPTSHHQAVRQPGRGLVPAAWADDSIIEAIEMEGKRFVVGVQWHPERDYEGNKPLFEAFVKACLDC